MGRVCGCHGDSGCASHTRTFTPHAYFPFDTYECCEEAHSG